MDQINVILPYLTFCLSACFVQYIILNRKSSQNVGRLVALSKALSFVVLGGVIGGGAAMDYQLTFLSDECFPSSFDKMRNGLYWFSLVMAIVGFLKMAENQYSAKAGEACE